MKKAAVLLIHGLGGTAMDMGMLPAQLRTAGYETYTPVLTGHGSKPEHLNSIVFEDWLSEVRQSYKKIAAQHETVHMVGMCMGALLVAALAAEERDKSRGCLVMLAPTLFIDGWCVPWYAWLRHLHYLIPAARRHYRINEQAPFGIKNERLRAIVQKRFAKNDGFHYAWIPLQSLWQLDRLRTHVRRCLPQLVHPTLIVQAKDDEFSSPKTATVLQQEIGSAIKQLCLLQNSYHMVCVDNDSPALISQVIHFLSDSIAS